MPRTRKNRPAKQKAAALRKHLVEKVAVSDVRASMQTPKLYRGPVVLMCLVLTTTHACDKGEKTWQDLRGTGVRLVEVRRAETLDEGHVTVSASDPAKDLVIVTAEFKWPAKDAQIAIAHKAVKLTDDSGADYPPGSWSTEPFEAKGLSTTPITTPFMVPRTHKPTKLCFETACFPISEVKIASDAKGSQ